MGEMILARNPRFLSPALLFNSPLPVSLALRDALLVLAIVSVEGRLGGESAVAGVSTGCPALKLPPPDLPDFPVLAVGPLVPAGGVSTGRLDGDVEGRLEGSLVGSRDGFLKLPLPDLPDFEVSIWHLLDLLSVLILPDLKELPLFDLVELPLPDLPLLPDDEVS